MSGARRKGTTTLAALSLALLLAGVAGWTSGARAASSSDDTTFSLSRSVDPNGLSFLRKTRHRTPTGFLYPYPVEPGPGITLDDWKMHWLADLGWGESWGGSDESRFGQYTDYRDGVISALRLETLQASTGNYAEIGATSLGRDDVSAFLDTGRRGWLRLRATYDELPRRYANDARILFNGVGSEHLTLPNGLVPSGSTDADIDAALASRGQSHLSVQRDKSAVELSLQPNPEFTLRAGYRTEEREGERPFGGAIRFAFQNPNLGSVIETIEPIDSRTHDFHGDAELANQDVQIALGYEGSLYQNHVNSLTWDNPFPGTNVDQGRFALAPDNLQHRVNGTLGFALPARGRFTQTASWISAHQDERLLAPTINPALPDWDGTSSLSREHADAAVETTVLTSTLRLSPLERLDVGAQLRYQNRNSRTDYVARNPAADDFGYVIEDGAYGVRDRFAAAPFDAERLKVSGDGTVHVARATDLGVEYEYERIDRDQRARATTEDHLGRVSLTTRQIPRTTVRLAYELSGRLGSSFNRQRDAIYYSAGPPDFAPPTLGSPQTTLTTFEQFDLADRRVQNANLRANFQLGEIADLALSGGGRDEDYDLRHGLSRVRAANVNVEVDVQPAPAFDAYAYGSSEWRRRELGTIASASLVGTDFNPGGPVFPFDRAYELNSREQSVAVGAGMSARPWHPLELRADYQVLLSRERIDYDYASAAALAPGSTAQAAGTHFPNLRNADHIVEASARVALTQQVAVRALYRYMHSTIANFQQDGLAPRIGHALYLAHRDGDFDAHVVGGTVQLRF
jgi:MtrB/PioB family decaheme-associated outer membrane protein